ncbi:hypothetical protein BC830DRAFT_1165381 [Chytriomyces sp. MP71]|nr:hypothetical protein BC830DRAFT_1165381 [Chytriomyces sp. MP71]
MRHDVTSGLLVADVHLVDARVGTDLPRGGARPVFCDALNERTRAGTSSHRSRRRWKHKKVMMKSEPSSGFVNQAATVSSVLSDDDETGEVSVRVKVEHNGVVRQLLFEDASVTWSQFSQEVRETLRLSPSAAVKASYVDEDGDRITLDSDRDLRAHLKLRKPPKLTIDTADSLPNYVDPVAELASRPNTWTPPVIISSEKRAGADGFPREDSDADFVRAQETKVDTSEKGGQEVQGAPDSQAVIDMLVDAVSADPDMMERAIKILHDLAGTSGTSFEVLFQQFNDTLKANIPSYNPEENAEFLPPRYTTVYVRSDGSASEPIQVQKLDLKVDIVQLDAIVAGTSVTAEAVTGDASVAVDAVETVTVEYEAANEVPEPSTPIVVAEPDKVDDKPPTSSQRIMVAEPIDVVDDAVSIIPEPAPNHPQVIEEFASASDEFFLAPEAGGELVTVKPTLPARPLPPTPPTSTTASGSHSPSFLSPKLGGVVATTAAPASASHFASALKSALKNAHTVHQQNDEWIAGRLEAAQKAASPAFKPLLSDATNLFKFTTQAGHKLIGKAINQIGKGGGSSSDGYRDVVDAVMALDVAAGVPRSRVQMLAVELDGDEDEMAEALMRERLG